MLDQDEMGVEDMVEIERYVNKTTKKVYKDLRESEGSGRASKTVDAKEKLEVLLLLKQLVKLEVEGLSDER